MPIYNYEQVIGSSLFIIYEGKKPFELITSEAAAKQRCLELNS